MRWPANCWASPPPTARPTAGGCWSAPVMRPTSRPRAATSASLPTRPTCPACHRPAVTPFPRWPATLRWAAGSTACCIWARRAASPWPGCWVSASTACCWPGGWATCCSTCCWRRWRRRWPRRRSAGRRPVWPCCPRPCSWRAAFRPTPPCWGWCSALPPSAWLCGSARPPAGSCRCWWCWPRPSARPRRFICRWCCWCWRSPPPTWTPAAPGRLRSR